MAAVQVAPGMAAQSKALAAASLIDPSHTLYVQQLPEKMQKEDLIRELYTIFSTYGHIIDIAALKTPKMRGQAHITFKDMQAAQQAMRALQTTDFFGRNIKISYSKNRSQAFAKLTGEYVPPSKTGPTTTQQAAANTGIAPIPGMPGTNSSLPLPPGMAAAPQTNGTAAATAGAAAGNAKKRARSEDGDVEMGGQEKKAADVEEDEDSDAEMDVSDDSD